MSKTVLVVDDDPTQRRLIQAVLDREGYAVVHAESGGEAVDRMTTGGGADLVLLDLVMPRMNGMECLAELRAAGVTTPVIVLTANAGVDTVVKAMQAGAQDFFVKPVSAERLLVGVSNALQLTRLEAEVGRLTKRAQGRASFDDLVGDGPAMRLVKSLGARAAKSNIPVLITGESGVGKEVIARALHGASDRAGKPFVAVNCGALPVNLIESILFGHEKGAFTGAVEKTLGKFREADGGVLFLDEIGELPLAMQTALLRVLEDRRVRPLGSERERAIDVRILTASNRDLATEVAQGRFRADLYWRLNVLALRLPPLRERPADVAPLARHFTQQLATGFGLPVPALDAATLAALAAHDWPGNVRELRNLIERALLLGCPPAACLPQTPTIAAALAVPAPATDAAPLALDAVEKLHILQVLDACGGNKSVAARRLGIARKTLDRKLAAWQGRSG